MFTPLFYSDLMRKMSVKLHRLKTEDAKTTHAYFIGPSFDPPIMQLLVLAWCECRMSRYVTLPCNVKLLLTQS